MADRHALRTFLGPQTGALTFFVCMPVAAAPDCLASDITLNSCCNAECIYSHARAPLKAPISLLILALLLPAGSGQAAAAEGIAMHGSPRETAGFTYFPYVNPDAPKGGRVTFAMQGSYDSLTPLIVKGEPGAQWMPGQFGAGGGPGLLPRRLPRGGDVPLPGGPGLRAGEALLRAPRRHPGPVPGGDPRRPRPGGHDTLNDGLIDTGEPETHNRHARNHREPGQVRLRQNPLHDAFGRVKSTHSQENHTDARNDASCGVRCHDRGVSAGDHKHAGDDNQNQRGRHEVPAQKSMEQTASDTNSERNTDEQGHSDRDHGHRQGNALSVPFAHERRNRRCAGIPVATGEVRALVEYWRADGLQGLLP